MDYLSDTGKNYIASGYKPLSIRERVKTDEFLSVLRKQQRWVFPDYLVLSGNKYRMLAEVRLTGDQGHTIRLIGFLDASKKEFVILIVCRHKGKVYKPPSCMDTAVDRYKWLHRGVGTIKEHTAYDDDEEIEEE